MTAIPSNFGTGGSGLVPNGSAEPALVDILRSLASDAIGIPVARTGIDVTAHVAALATPGEIAAVQATTATSAGIKQILVTGAPAAGQVSVSYDADGVPTLTFNADDAVTVAAVLQKTPATTLGA